MGKISGLRLERLGRVFAGDSLHGSLGYAALPVATKISPGVFRVFYSDRDSLGRSIARDLVLDLTTGVPAIRDVSSEVLLGPDGRGYFDDDGVMPTCVVDDVHSKRLFYIGWNKSCSVPFRNAIGMAVIGADNRSLTRISRGPLLDRNRIDPIFVASCDVQRWGAGYRMWYLSCLSWEECPVSNSLVHRYHIRYADSVDLVEWRREGRVALDFRYKNEYAISVPRVFERDGWKMLYSYRGGPYGDTYRLGYARSESGDDWTRCDEEIAFEPAETGWDSEMICYPFVLEYDSETFVLYNGNGYGATGFGIARMR